jgi:uncharacterized protein (TIGR03382 family)
MKGTSTLICVVLGSFGGMVGTAAAETDDVETIVDAPENPLETPWSKPIRTYKWVGDGVPVYNGIDQVQAAAGFSNVIYLNNCKPSGCTIKAGYDNSLTNTSSIPNGTSQVSAFAYSDTVWQQVLSCVKQTYAPFGVSVVDQRPASGNYHMAIVAGSPGNVGMQNGVGGVSPFGCGYLPNAISFSFANIYGPDVDEICWTVAQETAHSWGLDHKFDNRDPMTYMSSGPSRKQFINESGPCGEYNARSCQCGGSQMNSFKEILDTFGGSTPTPPTVQIYSPEDGAVGLQPEFPIQSSCTDDVSVSKVELRIDNQLVSTLESMPFVWNAPKSLGNGNHAIEVTCYDVANTPSKATIHASLGMPCNSATDCQANFVCMDGRCIAGGNVEGGLGTTCDSNSDCKSGQCASDGTGSFCVETCDPANDTCPSGFGCTEAGSSGVCWPGLDEGGICNAGGGPGFFMLGLGLLFLTRRRR